MSSTHQASAPNNNFTMVRIRRNILSVARKRAEAEDRSIANYIARLIKQDARRSGLNIDTE